MPESTVPPWLPFYAARHVRNTIRLSTDAVAAYFLILSNYMDSGSPLPDEDDTLAIVTRLPLHRWKMARSSLEPFFTIKNGFWRMPEIEEELAMAIERIVKRSAAAKAGAAAKHGIGDARAGAKVVPFRDE